jgi:hypothetical protein
LEYGNCAVHLTILANNKFDRTQLQHNDRQNNRYKGFHTAFTLLQARDDLFSLVQTIVKRAANDAQLKEMKAGIPNMLAAAPSVSASQQKPWDGLLRAYR